jgi:hypothetical protein
VSPVEWVQVKDGPRAPSQLERGHWYEVDRKDEDGTIQVKLSDGVSFSTHLHLVRLRDHWPTAITRLQSSTYELGNAGAERGNQGVCPTGHRLFAPLLPAQLQAYCTICKEMYPIEDEGQS